MGEKTKRSKLFRFTSLPVFAVISLMGFIYYLTVFVFVEGMLGLKTTPGILSVLVFSWLAIMCLLSFFVTVAKDPGEVPSSFAPETEDPQNDGVRSRFCDKCRVYKPPRSHHCQVCKRCVLKMDHHCVWIGNCVGYANYKPFLIFVLHAAMGSFYSMVIFIMNTTRKHHDFRRLSLKFFYVLCGLLIFLSAVSTSTLLGWHLYLLSRNMTTIEFREVVRARWLAKKRGQSYRHRFDHGICSNFFLILGPNLMTWFCPLALGHLKDGTLFPISND